MKVEIEKCGSVEHPANKQPKMVRIYKRANSIFVPIGWHCEHCGLMKRD